MRVAVVGEGKWLGLVQLFFAECFALIPVRQEQSQVWRQSTELCLHLLLQVRGRIVPKLHK